MLTYLVALQKASRWFLKEIETIWDGKQEKKMPCPPLQLLSKPTVQAKHVKV